MFFTIKKPQLRSWAQTAYFIFPVFVITTVRLEEYSSTYYQQRVAELQLATNQLSSSHCVKCTAARPPGRVQGLGSQFNFASCGDHPQVFIQSNNEPSKTCTMPWLMDDFAASLPDDVRKKIMSRLCRLAAREPLEAAEAYLNLRPYKEHAGGGVAYVHLRPNWEILENAADVPDDDELDWVDLKVGEAHDVDDRRDDYELDCVDEPILWAYCYQTAYPKLIERLTHLTLRAMGAQRVPYSCYGCGVRHREHFSAEKSGGLEVVAAIIEYWMRRIGEQPAFELNLALEFAPLKNESKMNGISTQKHDILIEFATQPLRIRIADAEQQRSGHLSRHSGRIILKAPYEPIGHGSMESHAVEMRVPAVIARERVAEIHCECFGWEGSTSERCQNMT
ncbi:hypothetical protein B0H13DRAFT_1880049 [Mycena leptocephala]|nr:hypothetical protein B0H13DRAFT_1880049 [Mycena leptocephala]